jgi:hypothetical protein
MFRPKLIARLWKLDETNKVDLCISLLTLVSYGTAVLPNHIGYHEVEFYTWTLNGNLTQETLGYFLSNILLYK